MKEINIAKSLIAKRREKGITQEELAAYIGVSKASVSKWETGQSYPDITFLPQLAAYFNISVDELIGYDPQMTKEDIRKLYCRLCEAFSTQPFEDVLEECREVIRKYYSCFPLLLQMAALLINHYMLAKEKQAQESVLREAAGLCARVKEEGGDISMASEANSLQAVCLLILNQPQEVLELLEGAMKPKASDESVLASALQMKGDVKKAKEVLQAGLYRHLIGLTSIAPAYLMLFAGDQERFQTILNRILSMAQLFDLDHLHPGVMLQVYLAGAQGYAMQKNPEKSIDLLERYTSLCTSGTDSFTLHGDDFFDSLDGWFAGFDLGTHAPRDEKLIRGSILQAVEQNPVFGAFSENPRYRNILSKLKQIQGGNQVG